MGWRPRTLLEAIDVEEEHGLVERAGRFECPNCGAVRHAAAIVDVSALPIAESWACDCCWTQWQRQGRVVDSGARPTDRKQWRIRWAQALGAPPSAIAKMRSARNPEEYRR